MIILRLIAILCSIIAIFLSGWNLSRIHYLGEKLDAMDAFNKGYLEGLQDGSMFLQKDDESQTERSTE